MLLLRRVSSQGHLESEVSSTDGKGTLIRRPKLEALVWEGVCVSLQSTSVRAFVQVLCVVLAVALRHRQDKCPHLEIRSLGAGAHGS